MTDLDARVAALPKRYEELQKSGVETDTDPKSLIIKALQDRIVELQKPELHEPVTDVEVETALATHWRLNPTVNLLPTETTRADMRRTLESFLQGRAKPEGEVVVTKNDLGQIVAVTRQNEEGQILSIISESAKPAQEEITDEQWLNIAESHANLDWDSSKPDGFLNAVISVGKAAIRASKGEKT